MTQTTSCEQPMLLMGCLLKDQALLSLVQSLALMQIATMAESKWVLGENSWCNVENICTLLLCDKGWAQCCKHFRSNGKQGTKEMQFLNNQDPTHNFFSTPTTKSTMPVDTDHVSIGMWSRWPPALMIQSMTKEPVQSTKSPQILLGAMFAYLTSNWKHCEDQQKKLFSICFQSTSLRNNSNDLLQIRDSLLFSMQNKNDRKNECRHLIWQSGAKWSKT